jgi:hypothetical protein
MEDVLCGLDGSAFLYARDASKASMESTAPANAPNPAPRSTPLSEALPANAPVNAPVRPPASRQHRKPASEVRTRARGRTAKGNSKGTRRPQRTDSEEAGEDAGDQPGEEALPRRRAAPPPTPTLVPAAAPLPSRGVKARDGALHLHAVATALGRSSVTDSRGRARRDERKSGVKTRDVSWFRALRPVAAAQRFRAFFVCVFGSLKKNPRVFSLFSEFVGQEKKSLSTIQNN